MRATLPILLGVLAVSPVAAQESDPRPSTGTGLLVAAGALGGAVGLVAGSFTLGSVLAVVGPETDDDLWTQGFVIGFETGQAVAIPFAVHLANRRRGNFQTSLLVSLGLGALGTAALWTGDFDAVFENSTRQVVLFVIPVAQIISSVLIERLTGRRR